MRYTSDINGKTMGNNKTDTEKEKVQKHRKEEGTNKCRTVLSKNRKSVEELTKRLSEKEKMKTQRMY